MNIEEVAAYLHLTLQEVERLVRKKRIPFEKAGDRVLFRNVDVEQWASQKLLDTRAGDQALGEDFHKRSTDTHFDSTQEHEIIPNLMSPDFIDPELGARTRASVLSEMTMIADETGLVNNPVDLLESLRDREELCSTALPGGVALLHPRHHHEYLFEESFVVLGRAIQPVPFGAPDGRLTDLFFLLCCGDDKLHLHMLARIASMCCATDLLANLRAAAGAQEMYDEIVVAELQVIRNLKR